MLSALVAKGPFQKHVGVGLCGTRRWLSGAGVGWVKAKWGGPKVGGYLCGSPVGLPSVQTKSGGLLWSASNGIQRRGHAGSTWDDNAKKIMIKFMNVDGSVIEAPAAVGATVLEVAHHHDVDLEGACEASLACSTCHVICSEDVYERIPDPSDREDDLLDTAPCLTATSRLACQVRVTEDLAGETFKLPKSTLNFYVDGHVPKPH
eukprot:CAMPEP_0113848674 /NCGR_PEP_ID=MMETSP0372-20130328/2627_1 /TAXON_ID=340204 /ORGANISM="Lankesteria abbotti" /LENGTH=204 /DNA_ID=CAMNT_0000818221 /DNA_START=216 /DNA_END=830 /DNA_ORIENTATION=- /assembly_acc=CAM_ASM_000359